MFLSSAIVETMASLVRAAAARVGRVIEMGMGSIGAGARRKPSGASPIPAHFRNEGAAKSSDRYLRRLGCTLVTIPFTPDTRSMQLLQCSLVIL